MSDIVLTPTHKKKLKEIAKVLQSDSVIRKRGYSSEAIRMAIDVLHGLMVEKGKFYVIQVKMGDAFKQGDVIQLGLDQMKIWAVIDSNNYLVENITNFKPLVKKSKAVGKLAEKIKRKYV